VATRLDALRTQVRDLLGDVVAVAENPTTWSDDQINSALDFACNAYCTAKKNTYKEAVVTSDVNGRVAITALQFPLGFLSVESVSRASTGELERSDLVFETRRDQKWRTNTGTARRWFKYDGDSLQLVPREQSLQVTVGVYECPAVMAADTDTVDQRIPVADHDALKYAAAYWLLMLDGKDAGDLPLAGIFMQTFLAEIDALPPQPKVVFRTAPQQGA
jgi:hypothetical protein